MNDREATLAALAGTAVDRLFLGGPFHGTMRTVNPDAGPVYAREAPTWTGAVGWTPATEPEVVLIESQVVTYRPRRVRLGSWSRTIMAADTVEDPVRELADWLLMSWIMEAPENT